MLPLLLMFARACQIYTMHRKNILELRTYVHTSRLFPTPLLQESQNKSRISSRCAGGLEEVVWTRVSSNKYKVTEETNRNEIVLTVSKRVLLNPQEKHTLPTVTEKD